MFISLGVAFAQQVKTVTGKVYDSKSNETVPGVYVRIKGASVSTVTDVNGAFSIRAKNTDVLVITSIGYETAEITVGARTQIAVNLILSTNSLQEVVVVGYGTQKKEDLTGSVGIVKTEQLEAAPVMSFDQALAGRIAGVQVSSSDGQPGSEGVNITIRGAGSLTQNTSPLYVVDGFPNEHFDPGSLNMNDIESINILKDASAIAIYGARASNGVVVIETKKGKVGKPVVTYNGSFGTQEIVQRMDMMSPYEFVKYQIERSSSAISRYTPGDLDPANPDPAKRTLNDYKNIEGVDWQDKVLRTGRTFIHNLGIRGGSAGTKYSISGSIFNNDAIFINTGQDRYQGRVAVDQEINKKLTAGINLNYSQRSYFGSQASVAGGSTSAVSSYLLYSVLGYRPVTGRADYTEEDLLDAIVDDDIDLNNDYRVNPVLDISNEYDKRTLGNLVSNGYVTYKIDKNFTFRTQGSINNQTTNREYFYNSQTRRGNEDYPGNVRGQWGGKSYAERFTWSNENTLTYKNSFNKKHAVEGLLGFSNQKSVNKTGGYIGI